MQKPDIYLSPKITSSGTPVSTLKNNLMDVHVKVIPKNDTQELIDKFNKMKMAYQNSLSKAAATADQNVYRGSEA